MNLNEHFLFFTLCETLVQGAFLCPLLLGRDLLLFLTDLISAELTTSTSCSWMAHSLLSPYLFLSHPLVLPASTLRG